MHSFIKWKDKLPSQSENAEGVTGLKMNSNSVIYGFNNTWSAYRNDVLLGGRIREMKTQAGNSQAK